MRAADVPVRNAAILARSAQLDATLDWVRERYGARVLDEGSYAMYDKSQAGRLAMTSKRELIARVQRGQVLRMEGN